MGLKQVSFIERSSLSRRIPYQRFHCKWCFNSPGLVMRAPPTTVPWLASYWWTAGNADRMLRVRAEPANIPRHIGSIT